MQPTTGIGAMYNMGTQQVAGSDVHEASVTAVTTSGTHGPSPLVALVLVAAVTFGMAGFSVSARVGKFGVSGHAGK
jgi:hypothetical protein